MTASLDRSEIDEGGAMPRLKAQKAEPPASAPAKHAKAKVKSIKSATVRARIEPALKARAERAFKKMGLTPAEAVRLLYAQVAAGNALPFPVKVPNATTRRAMRDLIEKRNVTEYPDLATLLRKLGLWRNGHGTDPPDQD
jgi:DNA-damage-inducible protein J